MHEIAEEHAPGQAHVVYIDNDPICRAHSEILLGTTADPARHGAICADYRDAEQLWEQVLDTGLIGPSKPLALLTVSLLHFIDDPAPALAFYQSQVPAGSLLAFNHVTFDRPDTPDSAGQIADNYTQRTINQVHSRTTPQIRALAGDWEIVEPGLVPIQDWRPQEQDPDTSNMHATILGAVGP